MVILLQHITEMLTAVKLSLLSPYFYFLSF